MSEGAGEPEHESPDSNLSLDAYLPKADASVAEAAPAAVQFGLRAAQVQGVSGRRALLLVRGASKPVEAEIAPEVGADVIREACDNRGLVLVEMMQGAVPVVIGALQTQKPSEIHLKAATVHIEGEQELLLRSGRAAIRIRGDGTIEMIGSRISAASRGLFQLVGRILRLN